MNESSESAGLQHTGMGGTVDSFVEDADPRLLEDVLGDDEIAQLQIVPEVDALISGETYLDVNRLSTGPFVAVAQDRAPTSSRLVAKAEVDLDIWERLTGG